MKKERVTKERVKRAKPDHEFELPRARVIAIDTSVSLLLTSLPPGNPGSPW